MNLFHKEPLAARLRPEGLEKVVGQGHIIEKLSRINNPLSLLLYGPPGSGKTTIALLLGKRWNIPFRSISATSSGVADVRKVIDEARSGKILLFLDEIHRFSSSQQDSLLQAIEDGRIVLIGATTEHPAFRINRPLLSRCHLFRLEPLGIPALNTILDRALGDTGIELAGEAREFLLECMNGDGRKLLGSVEGLGELYPDNTITKGDVEDFLASNVIHYDRNREYHYDVISAFIKSIRGSDPDAALYYLAIMLEGGEDPLFIMRRLVILASEDIGNASVHALNLAVSGMTAVEKIGMPEARITMAQVTTYLASCPKSNASYRGIDMARQHVTGSVKIPNHLRNPVSAIHKKEGAGDGYIYPHDTGGFARVNYFPDDMKDDPPQFYYPVGRGMEGKLKEYLKGLWAGKKNYE